MLSQRQRARVRLVFFIVFFIMVTLLSWRVAWAKKPPKPPPDPPPFMYAVEWIAPFPAHLQTKVWNLNNAGVAVGTWFVEDYSASSRAIMNSVKNDQRVTSENSPLFIVLVLVTQQPLPISQAVHLSLLGASPCA
jgi:hypothetical protein